MSSLRIAYRGSLEEAKADALAKLDHALLPPAEQATRMVVHAMKAEAARRVLRGEESEPHLLTDEAEHRGVSVTAMAELVLAKEAALHQRLKKGELTRAKTRKKIKRASTVREVFDLLAEVTQ